MQNDIFIAPGLWMAAKACSKRTISNPGDDHFNQLGDFMINAETVQLANYLDHPQDVPLNLIAQAQKAELTNSTLLRVHLEMQAGILMLHVGGKRNRYDDLLYDSDEG